MATFTNSNMQGITPKPPYHWSEFFGSMVDAQFGHPVVLDDKTDVVIDVGDGNVVGVPRSQAGPAYALPASSTATSATATGQYTAAPVDPYPSSDADMLRYRWEMYKRVYLPTEQAVAKQAMAGIPVDQYQQQASADVNRAFERQAGIEDRMAGRYGMALPMEADPHRVALDRSTELVKRAAEIGARNKIKRGEQDINLSRMMTVGQIGQNIPAEATSLAQYASSMESQRKAAETAGRMNLINSGLGLVSNLASFASGTSNPWSALGSLFKSGASTNSTNYNPGTYSVGEIMKAG